MARIKPKYNAKPTAREKAYHIWLMGLVTCACGCEGQSTIVHHPLTRHPDQRWRRDHEFVVPMTAHCHMALHACGKDNEWMYLAAAQYRKIAMEAGKL